jgi:hypothetical protein
MLQPLQLNQFFVCHMEVPNNGKKEKRRKEKDSKEEKEKIA